MYTTESFTECAIIIKNNTGLIFSFNKQLTFFNLHTYRSTKRWT